MFIEKRLPTICLLTVFTPTAALLWLAHHHRLAGGLAAFLAYLVLSLFLMPMDSITSPQHICVGPLRWVLADFRRHWLCVGKIGSGKTFGFIKTLLIEVCKKLPNWGGVAIDEKGDFWQLMTRVFRALRCSSKLVVLRCRLPGDQTEKLPDTINLIGDRSVPFETWAQLIVDVAVTQGQK